MNRRSFFRRAATLAGLGAMAAAVVKPEPKRTMAAKSYLAHEVMLGELWGSYRSTAPNPRVVAKWKGRYA